MISDLNIGKLLGNTQDQRHTKVVYDAPVVSVIFSKVLYLQNNNKSKPQELKNGYLYNRCNNVVVVFFQSVYAATCRAQFGKTKCL